MEIYTKKDYTLANLAKQDEVTVIGIADQGRLSPIIQIWLEKAGYSLKNGLEFDRKDLIDLTKGTQGEPIVLTKAKGTNTIAKKLKLLSSCMTSGIMGSDIAKEVALKIQKPLYQTLFTEIQKCRFELLGSKAYKNAINPIINTKYPQIAQKILETNNFSYDRIDEIESGAEIFGTMPNQLGFDIVQSGKSKTANNLQSIPLNDPSNLTPISLGGFEFNDLEKFSEKIQQTTNDFWQRIGGAVKANISAVKINANKENIPALKQILGESMTINENADETTVQVVKWLDYDVFMTKTRKELQKVCLQEELQSLGVDQPKKWIYFDPDKERKLVLSV